MGAGARIGFGDVYFGMARRAPDLTADTLKKKGAMALTRPMSSHPGVQHQVAEMGLELESIEPHLDRVADEWSQGVDHGAHWPMKILAAKYHAVEGSWKVADTALDLAGGFGIFRRSGIEQIFRDMRLGRIHPGNALFTHEVVGKTLLGVGLDDQPRWG